MRSLLGERAIVSAAAWMELMTVRVLADFNLAQH